MKKISVLVLAFLITTGLKAQQNYRFVSQQNQSVKYDTAYNAYFIDNEINQLANINITKKKISFSVTEKSTTYITEVNIENAQLDSLDKKMSFSIEGVNSKTGRKVKLSFWFIGEELDEVNYTDVATKATIGYKDLSVGNTDSIAQAVAVARPAKRNK